MIGVSYSNIITCDASRVCNFRIIMETSINLIPKCEDVDLMLVVEVMSSGL
jgi:hypothetical protein